MTFYCSDEVTVRLIYDREASHGKSIRFINPKTNQFIWIGKSVLKIEDDPIQGFEYNVILKRHVAEKEELI